MIGDGMKIKNKMIQCIFISIFAVSICSCGKTVQEAESELTIEQEESDIETETGTDIESVDEPGETVDGEEPVSRMHTAEGAIAFVAEADDAVHEFMVIGGRERPVHDREKVRSRLQEYFDDSIIDYILYIYQIKEVDEGYSYTDWYAEYDYYWTDMTEEMTLISQDDTYCEVGIVLQHGWRTGWDYETVPVRLEWREEGWKIVDISQWYNDFRYYYMPEGDFFPEYFTRELAEDLEECFGTDEEGNRVIIAAEVDENGYILADSSERLLSEEEIEELSKYELYLAVQEIYARHGKKFSDPVLYWHFNNQEWYKPYHFLFYEETLSEIETENIRLLSDKGKLAERAEIAYNSLYPVTREGEGVTEEEAACMVYHAFEMANEVISFKEENFLEDKSDDISDIYSLGEYSEEGRLKEYLSEWFAEDIFDYLTAMYREWVCLYQDKDGNYVMNREGIFPCDKPYFFYSVNMTETEENRMVVEMPFVNGIVSMGEITFEKRNGKWLITNISHPYYDEFYVEWQEFLRESSAEGLPPMQIEEEQEEPLVQRVVGKNTSEVGGHETENTNYALYPSTIVESDPKGKPSHFIPWETTSELIFPQIYYSREYGDYQNSKIETAINQELFNAIGYADYLSDRDTRLLREIMMDYEITKADDELISIKYYGTVLDVWHENDICYGITIDIQTGEKVALSEIMTLEDNLVERVENGEIKMSSPYDWEVSVGYIEEFYEDYQKGLRDDYTCYYLEEDAVNLVIDTMRGNNNYFILRIPLE
ncbi:MAG: YARHG domain-containing protein [Lachnospiraceae bacterium]|nr:YARHG domain-containing protein [Lachnospiraceae bacterium]